MVEEPTVVNTVSNITVSAEKESLADGSVSNVSFLHEKSVVPNTIGRIKRVTMALNIFILI